MSIFPIISNLIRRQQSCSRPHSTESNKDYNRPKYSVPGYDCENLVTKQPNGLYCIYSEELKTLTHTNLTKEELVSITKFEERFFFDEEIDRYHVVVEEMIRNAIRGDYKENLFDVFVMHTNQGLTSEQFLSCMRNACNTYPRYQTILFDPDSRTDYERTPEEEKVSIYLHN